MGVKEWFELQALTYFKMIVGVICLSGFLWQTILFLQFYYSYPTVLDLHLISPPEFIYPAFTFCNANLILRSKYCERYPDKCSAPENMEIFCERYPHYCLTIEDPVKANLTWQFDKNFMIPIKDTRYLRDVVPPKDLKEFTQNISTFVFTSLRMEDVEGPYFYEKPGRNFLFPCYTQNSRVDSDQEPYMSLFAPFVLYSRQVSDYPASITFLSLDIDPKEYLIPKMKPGAYFTVHSPYEAVNPHYKGVFMEPGKSYHVHIRLEEDHLLTPPVNDCVDYIERWKSAGKKGARSQRMCIEKCKLDYDLARYGCVSRDIMFPTKQPKCLFNSKSYISENDPVDEYLKCNSSCNRPCSKLKFHYTVEERPEIDKLFFYDDWSAKMTYISVYMEEPHITVRSQKPFLKGVDTCSYLGGFLCFWVCIFLLFTQLAQLIHRLLISYIEKRHPVAS